MQYFVMPYFSTSDMYPNFMQIFKVTGLCHPKHQSFRSKCAITQLHKKFPNSIGTQILPLSYTLPSPLQANESGPQLVTYSDH